MSTTYLYNDMLIYNITTNKWTKPLTVGHLPIARNYATGSFIDNNHLLVTGGKYHSYLKKKNKKKNGYF